MEKVNNKYINLWLSIWKINKPQYTFLKKNERKGLEKILISKLSFLAAIDPLPMLIAFLMAAPVSVSGSLDGIPQSIPLFQLCLQVTKVFFSELCPIFTSKAVWLPL